LISELVFGGCVEGRSLVEVTSKSSKTDAELRLAMRMQKLSCFGISIGGGANAGGAYEKEGSVCDALETTWISCSGGAIDTQPSGSISPEAVQKWKTGHNLNSYPAVISKRVLDISEIIEDPVKKGCLQKAVEDYLIEQKNKAEG